MRILIAEDERITRRKLRRQLEQMGHDVVDAGDGQEAWELFEAEPFPIVISDWEMPIMNGVELVRRVREADTANYVYIVMLTGKSDKKDVVAGIEAGADDFVSKPFDKDELRARLSAGVRIVELEHHLANANDRLRHELAVARELSDVEHRKHEESLLGKSISVRALREGIELQAGNDVPLLLCGPPGAGHEAVARAIHRSSVRRSRAFIYVSCPHISVANESIYGFQSGANEGRSGKTSLAHGGTLFLDGVDTLSNDAQEQLLSFLNRSMAKRAAGESLDPDVRIIAHVAPASETDGPRGALNDDLERLLEQNRLTVPSLAERKDDITVIAKKILDRRAISAGKALEGLSADAKVMLQRYSWPGNIRELHSVLERAILLANGTLLDIPEELLREGRRVGGYTLQRRLGEGGMGEVWLAQHALLARPSAVKLIRRSSLRRDADARDMLEDRFQREAKATAQLRSPNTVELYDFGVTDEGDFYYVMEYLNGVDLHSLVHEFGPLPSSRAVYFLRQACVSLGEAHLAGLVHRDVKPANLFVCQLGTQYDFLKLLDFGIVRATKDTDQTDSSSGVIKGSPTSMAPEAVQGKEVTFASDIYGLGCVAYWLLTGRQVFEAPAVMALLLKHVSQTPRPPSEIVPELPQAIDHLVLSCLEKDPSKRPRDANALGKILASLPIETPWDNQQARAWWGINLPAGGESNSSSDTSVELRPDTRSSIVTSHPSEVDLWNWSRGELSPVHAATIEDHLNDCDTCAKSIDHLIASNSQADAFTDRVRDIMTSGDQDKAGFTTTVDLNVSDAQDQSNSDDSSHRFSQDEGISDKLSKEWVGRRLGEFEVTKLLGASDAGVLLKARDSSIERDVAIKVLSDELYDDEVALNRFVAEAKSAGKLDHVNVVTMHEIVRGRSLSYLVMEFVPGGSTQDYLERHGPYSPGDATQIVIEACNGLSAAHKAGLIHRDIKPSNLLLTDKAAVKVSDFALAKQSDSRTRQMTLAGQVVGTVDYMSPEQCESAPVDARSDVYSLGATYYSLLTGKPPYEGNDPMQIMLKHRDAEPPDPREIRSGIPDVCAQIIEQAMARRPDERYESMDQLKSDLEAVMATVSGFIRLERTDTDRGRIE